MVSPCFPTTDSRSAHWYPVGWAAPASSGLAAWSCHPSNTGRGNNTTSYVLVGEDYPPEGEAEGKVARIQTIKSALALPWPAELATGPHRVHGFAHSPHGLIARVEWSQDGGAIWSDAELSGSQPQYSWARFEFSWNAEPGDRVVMTRASDSQGNTQPDTVPFNEKGYLFNQPLPHPIRVI